MPEAHASGRIPAGAIAPCLLAFKLDLPFAHQEEPIGLLLLIGAIAKDCS